MTDEWNKLPPDMFPKINELPGDLAQLAALTTYIRRRRR